jgi:hypothetical protein
VTRGRSSVLGWRIVAPLLAGVLSAAGVWLSGCAHHAGGPDDTLAAFGGAVERRDYDTAYALTSADFHKRVPLAAFRAQLDAGGAETQATGRQLREDARRRPLRIEVAAELADTLILLYEGGGWRVDGAPLDPWSQRTPRAALRTFIRALERRRYDVVLRLVPGRYRAGVSAEALRDYWEGGERKDDNAQLLGRLRAAAGSATIVEVGDEAHMPYAAGGEVHFVREDSAWKIEDPD